MRHGLPTPTFLYRLPPAHPGRLPELGRYRAATVRSTSSSSGWCWPRCSAGAQAAFALLSHAPDACGAAHHRAYFHLHHHSNFLLLGALLAQGVQSVNALQARLAATDFNTFFSHEAIAPTCNGSRPICPSWTSKSWPCAPICSTFPRPPARSSSTAAPGSSATWSCRR